MVSIPDRTDRVLLEIIRDNFNTQYASQAPSLAAFRDAVSTHVSGGIGIADVDDATLLAAFRSHVPLSTYDSYKLFVDRFNARPCRQDQVENLMAPGLPDLFALSSATSGMTPKMLPKYNHGAAVAATSGSQNQRATLDQGSIEMLGVVSSTAYRDLKEVERAPGEVVQRIPVCLVSGGIKRRILGWYTDEDESRMPLDVPGYEAPWAATVIEHRSSFLVVQGLFFLAHRDVKRFNITFAPMFVDLIRHIDQNWDTLVSSIRDGIVPDLEGIDHVRKHLQARFHANPQRADELLQIGSPFSSDGWVPRVWPEINRLVTVCSGPFASVLPKIRTILGPNVAIRCAGYFSSEASIGLPHANKLDEFVLFGLQVVEFLDVSGDETHDDVRQPTEVQVGKHYEPIVTTRDGLWRYQLGDVVQIVGFDDKIKSPVLKYLGRKSSTIRLPHGQITDYQLSDAIEALRADGAIQIQEFTCLLDDRASPPTVGVLVELMGPPLGPNSDARLASQRLFDALVATGADADADSGQIGLPTIRVLKTGTFAEYRRWRGECMYLGSGQVKVPVVLVNPTVKEWFLERVVEEL